MIINNQVPHSLQKSYHKAFIGSKQMFAIQCAFWEVIPSTYTQSIFLKGPESQTIFFNVVQSNSTESKATCSHSIPKNATSTMQWCRSPSHMLVKTLYDCFKDLTSSDICLNGMLARSSKRLVCLLPSWVSIS